MDGPGGMGENGSRYGGGSDRNWGGERSGHGGGGAAPHHDLAPVAGDPHAVPEAASVAAGATANPDDSAVAELPRADRAVVVGVIAVVVIVIAVRRGRGGREHEDEAEGGQEALQRVIASGRGEGKDVGQKTGGR